MRVQNYRCLDDVEIDFTDITTFIGSNGVGKSAVLRALDWFFNGTAQSLSEDDVRVGAEPRQISVEVEFEQLNELDRMALGKYAADGAETVRLWRRWEGGVAKLSGRAMTYPPFERVRSAEGARERITRYRTLRTEQPQLNLPTATSASAVEEALNAWESSHRDALTPTELATDGHFFGFAGQAKMTGLFDYVFVSADLRAAEEGKDTRGSIVGRILDQAVDRSQAEEELQALHAVFDNDRSKIHAEHFEAQLDELSAELTKEVGQLTTGRRLRVSSHVPELRIPQTVFQVSVEDGAAKTRIDQQGHGFQRALLITALRVLAERQAVEANRTVFLAIEEPELFQHPLQARTFASVLRQLAVESVRGMQIAYATHSPYFLEADQFHEVRRMTRVLDTEGRPAVEVRSATKETVQAKLQKQYSEVQLRDQFARIYRTTIPEAMFARAVILVEGPTDKGVLEGCAMRDDPLNRDGIMVAAVNGKQNMHLPFAILTSLGVPCFAVFDGDADCTTRKAGESDQELTNRIDQTARGNRHLLAALGEHPTNFPQTTVGEHHAVFHENLEKFLSDSWQDWVNAKKEIVDAKTGADKKSEHTYRQAAKRATSLPPMPLMEIIARARQMAREN
ncbi:ATP-dependent nuclease [Actinomadura logoneensis]|uniref:ATP-dependent nuclease n=1 Tax=Actinomadura logoneensis TaxID=2293572 RepID=UPI00131442EE|nr:AAA family ATPase [Actinomadura logoneensis]